MWREWGRSFDLSDATTAAQQWRDVLFVALVQGLPIVVLALFALQVWSLHAPGAVWLAGINAMLVAIRVLMLMAIRGSYATRSIGYWLSPLSDPVAAFRLLLSSVRRPRQWRGRVAVLREG